MKKSILALLSIVVLFCTMQLGNAESFEYAGLLVPTEAYIVGDTYISESPGFAFLGFSKVEMKKKVTEADVSRTMFDFLDMTVVDDYVTLDMPKKFKEQYAFPIVQMLSYEKDGEFYFACFFGKGKAIWPFVFKGKDITKKADLEPFFGRAMLYLRKVQPLK